jgi:hypothetical protein
MYIHYVLCHIDQLYIDFSTSNKAYKPCPLVPRHFIASCSAVRQRSDSTFLWRFETSFSVDRAGRRHRYPKRRQNRATLVKRVRTRWNHFSSQKRSVRFFSKKSLIPCLWLLPGTNTTIVEIFTLRKRLKIGDFELNYSYAFIKK